MKILGLIDVPDSIVNRDHADKSAPGYKHYNGETDADSFRIPQVVTPETMFVFVLTLESLDDQMIVFNPKDGHAVSDDDGFKIWLTGGLIELNYNLDSREPGVHYIAQFSPPTLNEPHSYICLWNCHPGQGAPRLWIDGEEQAPVSTDFDDSNEMPAYLGGDSNLWLMAHADDTPAADSLFTAGTLSRFGMLGGSSWMSDENVSLLGQGYSPLVIDRGADTLWETFLAEQLFFTALPAAADADAANAFQAVAASPPESGTAYQNETEFRWDCSIQLNPVPTETDDSDVYVELSPDGDVWTFWGEVFIPAAANALANAYLSIQFPVPPGWWYRITAVNANIEALNAIG